MAGRAGKPQAALCIKIKTHAVAREVCAAASCPPRRHRPMPGDVFDVSRCRREKAEKCSPAGCALTFFGVGSLSQ